MEDPLPLSSLKLLVPPLRLMSAVMWKVIRLRNIQHYGKVEEFVSLVTEAIPNILTDKQMRLLTLGLRAKMMLQMLISDQSGDLRGIRKDLSDLLSSRPNQVHLGNEALEANFVRLVQGLLEDPKKREHFFKHVCPVDYGPDFDAALETLACEFFTRLEKMLLIPDFKQTAVWITDTSSVLEEYTQCVSKADHLKVLLTSKTHSDGRPNMDIEVPFSSEQQLFSSLSLPPSQLDPTDWDSNAQTFENQRQSEEIFPQEAGGVGTPDGTWSSEEETSIPGSNNIEQTAGGRCSDSLPGVQAVEECTDRVSAPCQAPSAERPVSAASVIGPPRRRVAHKCAQCGRCFIYRYELVRHQRRHTGEHPYKCTQCGKAFMWTSDLSNHRKKQCSEAAYVCIHCGESFKSVQDRLKHRCGHSVQKINCSHCGKNFTRRSSLKKHELTHSKNRELKCGQCGEAYATMNELRSHQKTHPPEVSNLCIVCGKSFSSAASLASHEQRHRQQKTQICVLCGKASKSKHDLKLHMRTHTGERPFQCTYCGKRFSVSGNLTIHTRIHTGEKPYLCFDCGKAFVSAGELQIHRRTHTGERPHKCTVCERGFTMASKLKVHMRVHTGEQPYVCPECGKAFSRGSELKKHIMKHAGIRPHACNVCPKTYTCLNHLKRHLKTHSVVPNQPV